MAKNIVICCDGTANEFASDRTNVLKLYYTLEQDQDKQIAYYHPGLGTMEPAGALTTPARRLTRGLGMAFGYGLSNDIRDAYTYLANTYREDDRVYLFGFSRGAYTVRAVCSLLKMYGLIRPGNDSLVPYAIRMMMAIEKLDRAGMNAKVSDAKAQAFNNYLQLAGEFKQTMCRTTCKPNFVGLWDTVSSIGWKENPLQLPFTSDNSEIAVGRHAIAIDERRAFFRSNLWNLSPRLHDHGPKDLKQVWFAGVHSDVGGGYAESESGLAKIALEWMLEEARAFELLVSDSRQDEVLGRGAGGKYVLPNADGCMHESLNRWWKLAELIPKRHYDYASKKYSRQANHGKRRTIHAGSLVHASVFLRQGGEYSKRLNLPPDVKPVETILHPRPAN